MSNKDTSSEENGSNPNRRKVLQMLGVGSATTSGLGMLTRNASARGQSGLQATELSGSEAKKHVQAAIKTEEFRKLRQRIKATHKGRIKISEATVYEVANGEQVEQAVGFPVANVKGAVESGVALRLNDGSVTFTKGMIVKPTDSRASSDGITKEDISEDDSVSLEEFEVSSGGNEVSVKKRQISADQANPENGEISISESCVDACSFVLDSVCPGLCGLGGALFCSIVTLNSGGLASLGCGSFFVIYCIVVDYANPCFYKSSPEEDCKEIICPEV